MNSSINSNVSASGEGNNKSGDENKSKSKFANKIRPRGHGIYDNFFDCYRRFKIRRWKKFFSENGFKIIKVSPLLLYGTSEWPVIPTMKAIKSLASSVLFLMKKDNQEYSDTHAKL